MIFVLDSPEVLMRTALRYEHDRPATTIDSRRCEWRDQNSKNFRENWGLPPSCIYRHKSMIYDPQTPWYSYWTHLRYWWGQPCDMSTIDLRQQSIQGDVSEETNTVKIWGRIGGYLHHTSIVRNMSKKQVSSVESMEDMILWIFTRLEKIQKSKWREVYLLSPFILLDFF